MLEEAGCNKIVVNCHHLAEQMREALAQYPEVIIQKEQEILGTGGSLREALRHFSAEPVLVMNGDIYHDIDLAALYQFHADTQAKVTMAVHDYPRFNSLTMDKGKITSFSGAQNSTKAFTGVHVVDPHVIEMIPETVFFHIIDLYSELAASGDIAAYPVDGCFWCDMGTPADYLELHKRLLAGHPQAKQWIIDTTALIGKDVRFSGWGVVGKNVVIGAGASLTNAVVWENAVIAPESVIADAIVTGMDGHD